LLLAPIHATAQGLPRVVRQALKEAGVPPQAMGTYVQEVNSKKPLIASNAMLALNPASTMKLVTTDAALELLGPAYTWKTQVYAQGAINGATLQGDLIIKGGGDPKLVLENLWLLLRQIRAKGISRIQGDVVLDRSLFETPTVDPATFDGDPLKPYNVTPDALLLNFKTIRLGFHPDSATGLVRVTADPPAMRDAIKAPLLTAGDCGDWQSLLGASFEREETSFGGGFALACGEKSWTIHPYQMTPTQYFAAVFRQLWQDLGGSVQGQVRDGLLPPDAYFLTEWESASLPTIIRDINKYSNNVMARQLLLSLTAGPAQPPASIARGAYAIEQWLIAKGIPASELVIENGAGLSRQERISALTMARLLMAAFRSPLMPEFIASLPLAATDGTMKKRLTDRGVAGHAHIKSGTLRDVRAIAGYVLAASGKRYVVVSMINHAQAAQAQEAHDALLQWVFEH
jgi:D-alanyl-D-alanine carboxypeptidase/D-alanyl-D-alanine-endopeptidase (penicillin-binding protein 4)